MTDYEALLAPVFDRLTYYTHTVPASRFRPLPEHYVWAQVFVGRYSLEYRADWRGGARDEDNGFSQEFDIVLDSAEEVYSWDEPSNAWI